MALNLSKYADYGLEAQIKSDLANLEGGIFSNIIRVPGDYSTLVEARNTYTSGEVIVVGPGTYNESNLAKAGTTIRYHFMNGAIVHPITGESAIFDDTTEGINADMSVVVTGDGQFINETDGLIGGGINMRRTGSQLAMCGDLLHSVGATNAAIDQRLGNLSVNFRQITGDFGALYWTGGNAKIRAWEKISGGAQTVFGAAITANSHWHIDTPFIDSTDEAVTFEGAANGRLWLRTDRVYGTNGALNISDSLVYLLGMGKMESSVASANPAIRVSGGALYGSLQKIEGGDSAGSTGTGILRVTGGTAILDVLQIADTGMASVAGVQIAGGALKLKIHEYIRTTAGHGATVSGGTFRLSGTINTSNSSATNPIVKSGGNVILNGDALLVAEATRDSVEAASAQTVYSYGATANTVTDANVTIVGTLNVVPSAI